MFAVPFQAQIHYKATDGTEYLKIITKQLELSSNSDELVDASDVLTLLQTSLYQSANLSVGGNQKKARQILDQMKKKLFDGKVED